jgi:hypothetical protein
MLRYRQRMKQQHYNQFIYGLNETDLFYLKPSHLILRPFTRKRFLRSAQFWDYLEAGQL